MPLPDHDPEMLIALLAGCRRAERDAQRRLYGLYYSFALSVCLRYTRTRDEAMEAANDGFMKVFRDISRFDVARHEVSGSFRGWLKRIMIHTAIDHYRSQEKHQHQQELDEVAFAEADPGHSALDTLSYEELLHLIQQLSPAYRTVFNLYVIDGFTHEEVSTQLGISVGASKSNLSKARAHLKHLLKQTNHHAYAGYVG
ncbi:RNA polymerase sigma factor [Hymenobacter cellulosivorans]|uniref:RNA polymerase sigma factor n=1 Tax=Hymenobacter cellulosivorans TaxID=2932249 RepID=A0ABY4F958_9BACT|nr:RNA polymerase sigma factor [Hymenobacter cellulosivorans]UOQ53197.1 RNA polymerase sigma factor [Hymenobacter cellulosivorans]